MSYYYLDAANQPVGPLPLEEIRRKAASGEIPSHPMIAAAGSNRWQPLDGENAPPTALQLDAYISDRLDGILCAARGILSVGFLNGSLALATTLGHIAVLLGAAAGLGYVVYVAIRRSSPLDIGGGLLFIAGLLCAQFAARRFFHANQSLLVASRITSPALLDCLALLAMFGTASLLLGTITVCISLGLWQPLLPTLLTSALWMYFAAVALHPEVVEVTIGPNGAGEEVVGIIAFVMKMLLKLLPLFFFAWSVLGSLVIVLSFFDLGEYVMNVAGRNLLPLPRGFRIPSDALGFQGIGVVLTACLMVPLAHLMFLAVSLPLDLWRALLSVPTRLDALRK